MTHAPETGAIKARPHWRQIVTRQHFVASVDKPLIDSIFWRRFFVSHSFINATHESANYKNQIKNKKHIN